MDFQLIASPAHSYLQLEYTMIEPILKHTAGIDVHKKLIVVTILTEQSDGSLTQETREFGTFVKDYDVLAQWLVINQIELTVMESTGIYWKHLYEVLEKHQLQMYVVNARHVKKVPGRKTDVQDSQWLAMLARFGLLKPSFIPPQDLRELRRISRYRMKLSGMLAGEKNRLHKLLDSIGLRLGNVVSDIDGVSANTIIKGIINGESIETLLLYLKGQLKKKINDIRDALAVTLGARDLFLLKKLHAHIEYLNVELTELDDYLLTAMQPYQTQWEILQTMPGLAPVSAALLIIEMGVDMSRFGNCESLSSWAAMCPGNNSSANKQKSGKTRKGNQYLRRVLCETANAAIKTTSQFKDKYQTLVVRRGHKRSIIAIGHKMLRVAYTLLKDDKPYKDPGIDYKGMMIARNAPRWLKALHEYGYLGDLQRT